MFQTITDALRANAELFRAYPVAYAIGLTIGVALIYFKWQLIAKAQQKALRDNFEGWKQDGEVSSSGVLIMRPLRMRRLALLGLAFWGSGVWFMGFVVEPKPDELTKHWLVVAISVGFTGMSLWLLAISFDWILFDGKKIARLSWLSKPFAADLTDLERVTPMAKTIAGGVRLHFGDGRQLRVRARNSGYRQFLEALAERDLKLKIIVSAMGRHIDGER
ncbi:hypothetical protein AB838_11415 [Rhodobacteraceae bacterium (ex Bugula neritina AB1)]|nr:hypothetical protein AB838_11415 [Rhodobacteraceae bacterium (ex Bugula neritina AB1)]